MKLKKGDNIIVITGKDKGKRGKILQVFPDINKVIVEGMNISKVHEKSRTRGKAGQIVERSMPLSASNLMILDAGVPTRIGIKKVGGKSVRIAKKSGNEI